MLGILDAIDRAAVRHTQTERDLLDWDEVRQMAASGLIRFWIAHAQAHPSRCTHEAECCDRKFASPHDYRASTRHASPLVLLSQWRSLPAAIELVRRCYTAR